MPAKLKYGEPTQMISIRVPQSRKEEIRELVRGVLNGDDGWRDISIELPENHIACLSMSILLYDGEYVDVGHYDFNNIKFENYGEFLRSEYVTHWMPLPTTP